MNNNLFASIFLSSILGVILLFLHIPGAIIAFGITAGSLFWGLSLLVDLRNKLSLIVEQQIDRNTINEQNEKTN